MHWMSFSLVEEAHGLYTLEPMEDPAGVYGIEFYLSSPNYENSDPFLLLMKTNDFPAASVATAAKQILNPPLGDANWDGFVDNSDFHIWQDNQFTIGTYWGQADFNEDGITDVSDFNIWNSNRTGGGGQNEVAAVPEPHGMGLIATASLLFGMSAVRRGRQRKRAVTV